MSYASPLLAAPPDIIRWSPRVRGHGDCALCALELALGVSYENVLAAAITVNPTALGTGLTIPQMRKTAALLGFTLAMRRKYDVDEDTGILCVDQPQYPDAIHCVYLWEGRVIEPGRDQLWLQASAFLAHYKMIAGPLVVVVSTGMEE